MSLISRLSDKTVLFGSEVGNAKEELGRVLHPVFDVLNFRCLWDIQAGLSHRHLTVRSALG